VSLSVGGVVLQHHQRTSSQLAGVRVVEFGPNLTLHRRNLLLRQ